LRIEFLRGDPINENGERYSFHTSHDDVSDVLRETHSSQSSFKKIPFHPVISLSHISLNTYKTLLIVGMGEKMEDFMGNESIISD
jgi:hypothetical protein